MDDIAVTVSLPMERPLHRNPLETPLDSSQVTAGSEEFDSSALVSQVYIDRARLAGSVWDALGPQEQVSLRAVLSTAPLEHGLAELVSYLSLAEPGLAVTFDGQHREQLSWSVDDEEVERVAELPRVSFARDRKGPR
jgi:Protein of unknown function (DUF3375)